MPQTIGDAFVRVHANGENLDDDIREAFANAEPVSERAGRDSADAFRTEWQRRMQRGESQRAIGLSIRRSFGRGMAQAKIAENFFDSDRWSKFQGRLKIEFGAAGELAGQEMEREFRESGSIRGISEAVERIPKRVQDAQRKIAQASDQWEKQWRQDFESINRETEKSGRVLRHESDRMVRSLENAGRAMTQFSRENIKGLNTQLEQAMKVGDEWTTSIDRNVRSQRRMVDQLDHSFRALAATGDVTASTRRDYERLRREIDLAVPRLDRMTDSLNRTADASGRAFGRGSRNNFLNLFGSMTGGLVRLSARVVKFTGDMRRLGREMRTADREAGGGMRGLAAAAGVLGGRLRRLATRIGPALVGLGGFLAVLTPLAAVLSQATGALTALVSSLGHALVGAAGLAIGSGAALIAMIGGLVAALRNIPQNVKDAFEPLGDELDRLGNIIGRRTFRNMAKEAEGLEGVLKSLRPVVRATGDSLNNMIGDFFETLQSDDFGDFVDEFNRFLNEGVRGARPALASLGDIANNVFEGMLGLIRALLPMTADFLESVAETTENFADLNRVASKRNALRRWFERAGESASVVWDFLGSIKELLGTIFTAGQDAGDSLFGSMADSIREFDRFLTKNPQVLQQWFNDAKRFGEAIGNFLVNIGELIDALDTPETRQVVRALIDAVGDLISLISGGIKTVTRFGDALGGVNIVGIAANIGIAAYAFSRLKGAAVGAVGGLEAIGGGLSTLRGRMKGVDAATDKTNRKVSRVGNVARGAAGLAGVGALGAAFLGAKEDGASFGDYLTGTLGGALTGFAVGGPIGALIGAVGGGGLTALADAFSKSEGAARDQKAELGKVKGILDSIGYYDQLRASLDQVTGAYERSTRAAVVSSFRDEAGKLRPWVKQLNEAEISLNDLTNAVLHDGDARRRVNAVLDQNNAKVRQNKEEINRLRTSSVMGTEATSDKIKKLQQENETLNTTSAAIEERIRQTDRSVARTREDADAQARLHEQLGITRRELKQEWPPKVIKVLDDDVPDSRREVMKLATEVGGLDRKQIRILLKQIPGLKPTKKDINAIFQAMKRAESQSPRTNSAMQKIGTKGPGKFWEKDFTSMLNRGQDKAKNTRNKSNDNLSDVGTQAPSKKWLNFYSRDLGQGVDRTRNRGRDMANTLQRTTGNARPNLTPFLNGVMSNLNRAENTSRNKGQGMANILRNTTGQARPNLNPFQSGVNFSLNQSEGRAQRGGQQISRSLNRETSSARMDSRGFVGSISGAVSSGLGAASGSYSIGTSLKSGILSGLGGLYGALTSSLSGAVSGALAAAKRVAGISSPSKETQYIAEMLGEGLLGPLEKLTPRIDSVIERILSSLTGGAGLSLGGVDVPKPRQAPPPPSTGGYSGASGRSVDVGGVNIVTPTKDPRAVSEEVIAQIAALAY